MKVSPLKSPNQNLSIRNFPIKISPVKNLPIKISSLKSLNQNPPSDGGDFFSKSWLGRICTVTKEKNTAHIFYLSSKKALRNCIFKFENSPFHIKRYFTILFIYITNFTMCNECLACEFISFCFQLCLKSFLLLVLKFPKNFYTSFIRFNVEFSCFSMGWPIGAADQYIL